MRKKIMVLSLSILCIIQILENINIVKAKDNIVEPVITDEVIEVSSSTIKDVVTGADNFVEDGKHNSSVTINTKKLKDASNTVYKTLLTIGICVAVIVGSILGIQFMISAAEEKAKVKEALVVYIIGCVVVFGAFWFWKIFAIYGQKL